jgi:hypothetical protein
MARIITLSAVLALLAACTTPTTTDQPRADNAGVQPFGLSPSGAPSGRDDPAGTYAQPVYGPERRVEPPPPPRRP